MDDVRRMFQKKYIYIYISKRNKNSAEQMEEKTVGKQSRPSSFASQKFSGTNDFELTNSCKKSLVHPCLTVLFNLRARRVCVHDAYFWPRWCALEKGDDMCSNIAAQRGIIAIVPPAYKYVLYGFFGWNGGPCFTALFIRFSTNNRLPETSFSHCQSSIQSTRSLSFSPSNAIRIARDPERILEKKCTPRFSTPSTNINKR